MRRPVLLGIALAPIVVGAAIMAPHAVGGTIAVRHWVYLISGTAITLALMWMHVHFLWNEAQKHFTTAESLRRALRKAEEITVSRAVEHAERVNGLENDLQRRRATERELQTLLMNRGMQIERMERGAQAALHALDRISITHATPSGPLPSVPARRLRKQSGINPNE